MATVRYAHGDQRRRGCRSTLSGVAEAGYITGQVIYVDGGKLSYVPGVDMLKSGLEVTPS